MPDQVGEARTGNIRSDDAQWHEATLIRRIAKEDRVAFEELYRLYFPRLVQFLRVLTRNVHLTEEVINDAMLVVWQKAGTYNYTAKVSTWIFSIAYRRGLKAIKKMDEPVDADFENTSGSIDFEPEHGLNCRQLKARIEDALNELPQEQRSVVALTYYHGMAYEEIAQTMECPINTVKTRMFHARRKLKSLLFAYQKEAL